LSNISGDDWGLEANASSLPAISEQNNSHCFRTTAKNYPRWTARPFWYSWTILNCVVLENGAHAGWDCICGISWRWTHFGNSVCRQAVRGQTCPRGNGGWLNLLKALSCYRLIDPGRESPFPRGQVSFSPGVVSAERNG